MSTIVYNQMNFDPDCIFCKIVARQMAATIIYENADAIALLDIRPIVPGHTLVVPKNHRRNLFDFDDSTGQSLMHAQRVIARALRAAFNADGLTVFQSNEAAGGQSVFHYHAHLIPRYHGDGLIKRPDQLPHTGASMKLSEVAEKIRANLVED